MEKLFHVGFIVGVLCSDGYIWWDKKGGHYAFVLESKDREFVEIFRNNLSIFFNKKLKIYERLRKYKNRDYKTYILIIYGKKQISKFLDSFHIKKAGTYNWSVPIFAFKNQRFRRGFLRGFFDGEGTVRIRIRKKKGKTRSVRVSSVNKKGLYEVKKLLELEGIKSMFYPQGEKCFMVDIEGKNRLKLFQKKINFSISRKREKLEEALA